MPRRAVWGRGPAAMTVYGLLTFRRVDSEGGINVRTRLLGWVVAAVVVSATVVGSTTAATPSSGSIGPADGTSVTWTGPERTAATTGPADGECNAAGSGTATDPGGFCDDFSLIVNVPKRQGAFTVDVTGVPGAD